MFRGSDTGLKLGLLTCPNTHHLPQGSRGSFVQGDEAEREPAVSLEQQWVTLATSPGVLAPVYRPGLGFSSETRPSPPGPRPRKQAVRARISREKAVALVKPGH